MAIRSTIMDTNSFRAEHADALNPDIRKLTDKRRKVLGESYRLFYRRPVHLVRGEGQYLWDAAGNKYLDVYNNVASIGHCHPAVINAVNQQMSMLNTHTRYLHERILDYSEALLATMPAEVDRAMYMCTGSEANDLAIRVARAWSGGYRDYRYPGGLPRHQRTDIRGIPGAGERPAVGAHDPPGAAAGRLSWGCRGHRERVRE